MMEYIDRLPVYGKIAAIVFVSALIITSAIKWIAEHKLEDLMPYGLEMIRKAETRFNEPGDGPVRKRWVVSKIRWVIPAKLDPFITDAMIEEAVQIWFELVKDFLDDGKLNGSEHEEEDAEDEY